MTDKKHYVLGFLFNEEKDKVVLIRKNRPKMRLVDIFNGVGGALEEFDNHNSFIAMKREFEEETSVYFENWNKFCEYTSDYWSMCIFKGFGDISKVKTMTDEEVGIFELNNLPENLDKKVKWLIPMALNNEQYIIEKL